MVKCIGWFAINLKCKKRGIDFHCVGQAAAWFKKLWFDFPAALHIIFIKLIISQINVIVVRFALNTCNVCV